MEHKIKIKRNFFEDILNDTKTFEIRKNDRNYAINDYLLLQEFEEEIYSGREIRVKIIYMIDSNLFADAIKDGYVVLGIKKMM